MKSHCTSGGRASPVSPVGSICNFPGPQVPVPSQPLSIPSDSMDASWLSAIERSSLKVQKVHLNSRKHSTGNTYLTKWKHFSIWSCKKGVSPDPAPLDLMLDCLLDLKQSLAISSMRVNLVTIPDFNILGDNRSPFSPHCHLISKGLVSLYLHVRDTSLLGN